jgi:hypothetical protein
MRLLVAAAAAVLVMLTSPAHAALEGRDINGDGVTDAFYDTDLKITWLRDAGLSSLSTFAQASAWADNLVVGKISDWRLPTSDVTCQAFNCVNSEMGHLFYTELASIAPHNSKTGSFQNVATAAYWSGTVNSKKVGQTWAFSTNDGSQFSALVGERYSAMAVRNGDVLVASVPEPETYAMLLSGLACIGLIARRRKRQTGA